MKKIKCADNPQQKIKYEKNEFEENLEPKKKTKSKNGK